MAKSCPLSDGERTPAPPEVSARPEFVPDRYRSLELLGEGGMGKVFRAYDTERREWVALKTVRTASEDERRALEWEVRLLRTLRHEGIVTWYDVGAEPDGLYYTMEFVEGVTLEALSRRPPPDRSGVLWMAAVAVKALDALEYVHEKGWIHGDLKPANILVEVPEDRRPSLSTPPIASGPLFALADPVVKLLDFGLARERESALELGLPVAGTPLYMAPEQLLGNPSRDGRSDLYSLGAVLYRLVTGRPPFTSLREIREGCPPPSPPKAKNPECPEGISELILRLLRRDPHERPSSARETRLEILAQLDPGHRRAAAALRLLPPVFVGRIAELERLRTGLRLATDGEGCSMRLIGEPGAGKTWLLDNSGIRGEASLDFGMAQVRGTFTPGGAIYAGLRQVLGGLLRVVGWARGHGACPEALGPWGNTLLETFDLGGPDSEDTPLLEAGGELGHHAFSQRLVRERILVAAAELLRAVASERPVLITVENVHHADELEIELLARLERISGELPVAFVLSYRPENVRDSTPLARWIATLQESSRDIAVPLDGFTDQDIRELLSCVLRPAAPTSEELVQFVSRRSEGNPQAAVRALRDAWSRGSVTLQDDTWILREPTDRPDEAEAAHQIDRVRALAPEAASVMSAAVVIGEPFDEELILDVLEPERGDAPPGERAIVSELRVWLRSLVEAGALVHGNEGYHVPSDFGPGTALELAGPETVRRFHDRTAVALRNRYARSIESHALRIGRHLELAGQTAEARKYYLQAARHAGRIYANRRGIEAYLKALDLSEDDGDKREIAEELGELYTRVAEYPVALECFSLARSLTEAPPGAPKQPEGTRELDLLHKIGCVLHRQGELAEALSVFSRCLEQARDNLGDRARALFRMGGIHLDRGDAAAAIQYLEQSLKTYERLGNHRQMAVVQACLGIAEKNLDHLEHAVVHFTKALENAERVGSLLDVATTLNNLGNLHRARGNDRKAIECLQQSIEARRRMGDRQGLAICFNNIARVHAFRGDIHQAVIATENALEIFEEVGDKKGVLIARSNLGELAQIQSDFPRALELFHDNLRVTQEFRVQRLLETNLCNLGELELDRGNYSEAMEYARTCLDSLPGDTPLELRAQALGILAGALIAEGKIDEAHETLQSALSMAKRLKLREKLAVLVGYQVRILVERGEPEKGVLVAKPFLLDREHATDKYSQTRLRKEMGRAYREMGPDWADKTEDHLLGSVNEFDVMGSVHNAALARAEYGLYLKLQGASDEATALFRRAEEDLARVGLERRITELRMLRSVR